MFYRVWLETKSARFILNYQIYLGPRLWILLPRNTRSSPTSAFKKNICSLDLDIYLIVVVVIALYMLLNVFNVFLSYISYAFLSYLYFYIIVNILD